MDVTKFPEVVELNAGGKFMTTLLSTLTKEPESMLAAMFSGRHVISKDKDDRFFIDCDGNLFEYILNYLRFGTLPPKEKALEIYDIAVYFNVHSLVNSLEGYRAVQYRKGIEQLRTRLDMQEYSRLKQEATKQLYRCFARREDAIIILFMGQNQSCSAECFRQIRLLNHPIKFKHTIILQTSDKIMKEMKLCIAHDLNELGFGKYIYTVNGVSFNCPRCQKIRSRTSAAFLVAYQIITLPDDEPGPIRFV